jgi:isopenicillin-N N-acyltransferase-like protein
MTAFLSLDLAGDPYRRGLIHGESCREMIARHIALWRETSATPDRSWRGLAERMLTGTGFAAAAQRWTPGAWAEIKGIAAGAGQEFAHVLLLNLTDEQWWVSNEKHTEACTSFAYRGNDGAIWSGQNLDISAWMDGLQVVLRYDLADGGSAAMGTLAGTIGMTGINSHGLSICCNTLLQLPPTRIGLPCLFVMRGVMERKSRADAAHFLRAVTHASGLHYLLADAAGWAGYECDATGIRQLPSGYACYGHTNHPKATPESGSPISRERLAAIDEALSHGRAVAALAERPLMRDGNSAADPIGFTIFSAYWRNESSPIAHFCAGPPRAGAYQVIKVG